MFSFFTVLSSLEMRCELRFVLFRPSFQFANTSMLWCRQWIANHDRQDAYHNLVREVHIATAQRRIQQLAQNEEGTVRRPFKQDPATDQAPQHQLLHVHQCWTANCDVIFGNWVHTCLQTRSHHRRHSTKLFSLKYIEDY